MDWLFPEAWKKWFREEERASFASRSADVRIEDVVIPEPAAEPSSSPVSTSSLAIAINILKHAMAKYCLIYDRRVQDLLDALEVHEVSFEGKVELLIVDPINNILCQAGRSDSKYEVFKKQDIADIVDLSEVSLTLGQYDSVFCSTLQLAELTHDLKRWTETEAVPREDRYHKEKKILALKRRKSSMFEKDTTISSIPQRGLCIILIWLSTDSVVK